MRFYNEQHPFYGWIDLHTRELFLCLIDQQGNVLRILPIAIKKVGTILPIGVSM